jgi:hypothetical protein
MEDKTKYGEMSHGDDTPLLTKQDVEKALGYEIQDFSVEPTYMGNTLVGYNVRIVPISVIEKLNHKITIANIKDFEDE